MSSEVLVSAQRVANDIRASFKHLYPANIDMPGVRFWLHCEPQECIRKKTRVAQRSTAGLRMALSVVIDGRERKRLSVGSENKE